ncbi:hypothetical protein PRUPE_1G294300 [Prunus persica]|uniref:Uncharacterized protein n=1 Tax=Prunus persica TaxID=3760 RepID=A0A251R529_PRUPE|nr:hypothetical protein PRUPE_1G294300 [Prunus persica]
MTSSSSEPKSLFFMDKSKDPICCMRLPKKIVAGEHKSAAGGGLCTSSS